MRKAEQKNTLTKNRRMSVTFTPLHVPTLNALHPLNTLYPTLLMTDSPQSNPPPPPPRTRKRLRTFLWILLAASFVPYFLPERPAIYQSPLDPETRRNRKFLKGARLDALPWAD